MNHFIYRYYFLLFMIAFESVCQNFSKGDVWVYEFRINSLYEKTNFIRQIQYIDTIHIDSQGKYNYVFQIKDSMIDSNILNKSRYIIDSCVSESKCPLCPNSCSNEKDDLLFLYNPINFHILWIMLNDSVLNRCTYSFEEQHSGWTVSKVLTTDSIGLLYHYVCSNCLSSHSHKSTEIRLLQFNEKSFKIDSILSRAHKVYLQSDIKSSFKTSKKVQLNRWTFTNGGIKCNQHKMNSLDILGRLRLLHYDVKKNTPLPVLYQNK